MAAVLFTFNTETGVGAAITTATVLGPTHHFGEVRSSSLSMTIVSITFSTISTTPLITAVGFSLKQWGTSIALMVVDMSADTISLTGRFLTHTGPKLVAEVPGQSKFTITRSICRLARAPLVDSFGAELCSSTITPIQVTSVPGCLYDATVSFRP